MGEIEFTQTERIIVAQILHGANFETICQKTAMSSHSVQSVLSAIVKKLGVSHPEILIIKQFCDKDKV